MHLPYVEFVPARSNRVHVHTFLGRGTGGCFCRAALGSTNQVPMLAAAQVASGVVN